MKKLKFTSLLCSLFFMYLLIFITNFNYAQNDIDNLKNNIASEIMTIGNLLSREKQLYTDYQRSPTENILEGCKWREDANPYNNVGRCNWGWDDEGSPLIKLKNYLNEVHVELEELLSREPDRLNFGNILAIWDKLSPSLPRNVPADNRNVYYFPYLELSNPRHSHRHLYVITMGVSDDRSRVWGSGTFAKDIIFVHLLNKDGLFSYVDFFNRNFDISNELDILWDEWKNNMKTISTSTARDYLNYLKNNHILEAMATLTENFNNLIYLYDAFFIDFKDCGENLQYIRNYINSINSTTILSNILNNLETLKSKLDESIGDSGAKLSTLLEGVYDSGFLVTFFGGDSNLIWNNNSKKGHYHVFPNNVSQIAEKFGEIRDKSANVLKDFTQLCATSTIITNRSPDGRQFNEVSESLSRNLEELSSYISYVVIEVTPQEISLAVIPPVVWSDQHRGRESFKEITPGRIFDEIRNFLFSLAPIMFILLLVVGAIFYIVSPIKIEYIKTGSEYIKWAVIGYFLLLAISAIFSALKVIFGAP